MTNAWPLPMELALPTTPSRREKSKRRETELSKIGHIKYSIAIAHRVIREFDNITQGYKETTLARHMNNPLP